MTTHKPRGHLDALSELETTVEIAELHAREAEWGGLRVASEAYHEAFDDSHLLVGLPDDRCQCPHWGHLLSGRMTVRYADHQEVVEVGELDYVAPDHTIRIDDGTELVGFSPMDESDETLAVVERNPAALL